MREEGAVTGTDPRELHVTVQIMPDDSVFVANLSTRKVRVHIGRGIRLTLLRFVPGDKPDGFFIAPEVVPKLLPPAF